MKRSIVNPLIEPLARLMYRAKKAGRTSIQYYELTNPEHIEVDHAVRHFSGLAHTKSFLGCNAYGKYYIEISWLNEVESQDSTR